MPSHCEHPSVHPSHGFIHLQIYHLASPASPPHYMFNPIKTIKTNTIGTINMLGLAKRCNARLLLASTSEVYGDPQVRIDGTTSTTSPFFFLSALLIAFACLRSQIHPQVESYFGNVNTVGPRSCYDEGKRIAETMCYSYQQQVYN